MRQRSTLFGRRINNARARETGILSAQAALDSLIVDGALKAAYNVQQIGFIAGAGIVVRNSIILVDFVELRLKQGMTLADAVIDAGAVRFRPMMLTAAAVIVGSAVILIDPFFQGLAISLMAGEVASLLLSRMTVPVLFYMSEQKKYERPSDELDSIIRTLSEQLPHDWVDAYKLANGQQANLIATIVTYAP